MRLAVGQSLSKNQLVVQCRAEMVQIQAAKPTEDWDGRFGKNAAWTPAQFVEAIYKSLAASKGGK